MFINKNISIGGLWRFTGKHLIWITLWVLAVFAFHAVTHDSWINVPWLPISVIGTAVAFYVTFKNNQAYDRLWEARKIWGGIVNYSRSWSAAVLGFVSNQFADKEYSEAELLSKKRQLIYRHVAWLYALRSQLLIPTNWEHAKQSKGVQKSTEKMRGRFGTGLYDDEVSRFELKHYLPEDEYAELIEYKNTATQIINKQSLTLKALRQKGIIEDFRHMELQSMLTEFYALQGKAERIKKFPLPRQYGGMSAIFVGIFIFLIPFGMLSEFHKLGEAGAWLSIPFSILVSWLFLVMELVGDYSENPFEGLGNDIPMLALCRTIEIDLKQMLNDDDIPEPIQPVNGVLM